MQIYATKLNIKFASFLSDIELTREEPEQGESLNTLFIYDVYKVIF